MTGTRAANVLPVPLPTTPGEKTRKIARSRTAWGCHVVPVDDICSKANWPFEQSAKWPPNNYEG
jgi:hypothetical protein